MRFYIEEISSSKPGSNAGLSPLMALYDGSKLLLSTSAMEPGVPGIAVQAFNPERDVFYRSPEKLTPDELSEEIAIHIPEQLRANRKDRVAASSIAGLVLMQFVPSDCRAISPLAALEEILRATGSVNSAILHADNAGLLFVRRAGAETQAHASNHSLKQFLNLTYDERETIFPDFHTTEIIVSGAGVAHFENLDLDNPLEQARRISISDFAAICDFGDEAAMLVNLNPHLYTLTIGAASVFATIIALSEI